MQSRRTTPQGLHTRSVIQRAFGDHGVGSASPCQERCYRVCGPSVAYSRGNIADPSRYTWRPGDHRAKLTGDRCFELTRVFLRGYRVVATESTRLAGPYFLRTQQTRSSRNCAMPRCISGEMPRCKYLRGDALSKFVPDSIPFRATRDRSLSRIHRSTSNSIVTKMLGLVSCSTNHVSFVTRNRWPPDHGIRIDGHALGSAIMPSTPPSRSSHASMFACVPKSAPRNAQGGTKGGTISLALGLHPRTAKTPLGQFCCS